MSSQRLRAIGLISLGPIKGSVNWWKSTYLDNTVVQNESGVDENDRDSFNFKNLEIQYTLGTQDQPVLKGFEGSEREVSVGTEVKKQHSITRSVIDPDITRLRLTIGVNALFSQNDQGDTNGTSVNFRVLINGQARGNYEINGKSSSRFYRNYIIDDLPPRPFTLTVERLTEDSKSQRLQNTTHWVSYTEIIDTKLNYPNMALVGIKADSRYTPNFPNVNFLLYGRIIKIPSTYDPEKRTYAAGIWKGDWKLGWTNNPAWIFYDLITNKMAGLGQRIGDYGIDKFQLYEVAKYCDELVDDGYGGKEPRMVANLWITEQREAYNVISDMASVFRAIAVWDGTQLTAIQDRPADPVCLYTQANIVNGKITRQYAAGKAIFTAVEVEYADERNMYQKAIEYVSDDSMIARYGYNAKKITAFGCTSRGQAHRYGKWVLETSRLEQCTISFTVGRQGLMHLPGDIIEVADNDYAGQTIGGRVVAVAGKQVTLDRAVEISENSYLSYLNTDYQLAKSKIISAQGAVVTLDAAPNGLKEYDDWVLKTPTVSTQLYRALGITENEDGSYTISALQHEPQKEAIVDGSASFAPSVTTTHGAGVNKPANADISFGDGGVKLMWTTPTNQGAVKYDVKLYRNGNLYSTHLDLDSPEISFDNLPNGRYTVEIRSKNSSGQLSDPVTRTFEVNLNIPRFVTKSLLFAIELDWDLPKIASVGNYTEVWRSTTNDISKAVKVATLPYPQNNYVMSGVPLSAEYYFWLRCGDKNDNKGEFTEAVFGEADHNPDNLLNAIEGKITKSHLGQELINSLKNDVNSAVSEEAKARIAAVNNALQQINNQAATTGTAIQKLEKADKAQAETIKTVTAKAESALSGITAVQQAQANSDKANAQQISALTARMGTAESSIANIRTAKADRSEVAGIAQQSLRATWQADAQAKADKAKTDAVAQSKAEIDVVSRAVAGVNGKLSATHTIKTQVVAGGRTAIAGIALGASSDGKIAESSVIVMADKFGIVANANDSNVKPVFSVANGQVGIRGDLVVAGTITRDKFSSGSGENLLYNPIFANPTNGVPYGWIGSTNVPDNKLGERQCIQDPDWGLKKGGYLPNENVVRWHNYRTGDINTRSGISQNIAITANTWYMLSVYMGNHRSTAVQLYIDQRGSNGEYLGNITKYCREGYSFNGINNADRVFIKFQAHPHVASLDVHFFFYDAKVNETNCYMFLARPMLEECTEHTTEPSPWANAGVTQVHGGSIIANTIRGEHIQANQEIRAPKISGGEIDISGGDGVLKVGRTGSFLVRASSQNRGLVMNNNQIIVYDDRGVVRVKIGYLL